MNNNNNDQLDLDEISDEALVQVVISLMSTISNTQVHAAGALAERTRVFNRQAQIIRDCLIEYYEMVRAFDQTILNYSDDMSLFLEMTNATQLQVRVTYPRLQSNKGFWEVWHPNLIDDEVDNSRPTMTFKYHYRMSRRTFSWLCQVLSEHTAFQFVAHNATPVYQQVASILWRFGSCHVGYMMQKSFFGFGQGSYNNFTNRFLDAMTGLTSNLIAWPKTFEQVEEISRGFEYPHGEFTLPENKKLPGCIGAVDGKLIHVYKPRHNPESYRDRKGNISINLLAVCDGLQRFTYIYVGESGKYYIVALDISS